MHNKKYYKAYDDRYRQVHGQNLQWFSEHDSPIVKETIRDFSVSKQQRILEIGCGEGRDAYPLLKGGYDLLATDVSPEAISFCREKFPQYKENFRTLDCIAEELDETFDLIYAVAVLHMLVPDDDRSAFYRFIRRHLSDAGIALICSMGDGTEERQSDISTAFELQDRTHMQTGTAVQIAGTSCRVVSFPTFENELERGGLRIIKKGLTAIEPDFSQMMFAVVGKS